MPELHVWWKSPRGQIPTTPPDLIRTGPEVCDFCDAPEPVWDYPCPDFVVEVRMADGLPLENISRGSWGACPACAERIDAGDVDGVIERCRQTNMNPDDWPGCPMAVRRLQVTVGAAKIRFFFGLREKHGLTGQKHAWPPEAQ